MQKTNRDHRNPTGAAPGGPGPPGLTGRGGVYRNGSNLEPCGVRAGPLLVGLRRCLVQPLLAAAARGRQPSTAAWPLPAAARGVLRWPRRMSPEWGTALG